MRKASNSGSQVHAGTAGQDPQVCRTWMPMRCSLWCSVTKDRAAVASRPCTRLKSRMRKRGDSASAAATLLSCSPAEAACGTAAGFVWLGCKRASQCSPGPVHAPAHLKRYPQTDPRYRRSAAGCRCWASWAGPPSAATAPRHCPRRLLLWRPLGPAADVAACRACCWQWQSLAPPQRRSCMERKAVLVAVGPSMA